jgi:hypothetical protein
MLLIAGLVSISYAEPSREYLDYKISRGMGVKILKNSEIPYIHAQLVIYYREKPLNPAIPYLTQLNIFDTRIAKPNTSLLNTLRRLGNDFEVEHRPDFLLFKINFLPDKIPLFVRFLKSLYQYRPFLDADINPVSHQQRRRKANTLERFKDSIDNYWKYYFYKPGWKKRIAFQIAYNQLFPGSLLGQTRITPKHLKEVTLDSLRTFHKKSYLLTNSQLILKGNIKTPAVVYGRLERAFSSFKKPKLLKYPEHKITINNERKVLIFNTDNDEMPSLFWFEPIPTGLKRNPIPFMVLNNLLFGFPTGRIFITATRLLNISNLRIYSELVSHRNVSVICNTIRIRYRDIEKFIILAQREKKKLSLKGIDRREYLDTRSYIYGRLKVNTQNVGYEVSQEILDMPVQYPQITLAGLNKSSEIQYKPVIVIVGNIEFISRYAPLIYRQAEIIDFMK